MIHNPHPSTLLRTVALSTMPGGMARCDHCGKLIRDPTTMGDNARLVADLRRGDLVLGDLLCVVQGPEGEQHLCLPCTVRSGVVPTHAVARPDAPPLTATESRLWARRGALLVLFGGLVVALAVFEVLAADVGTLEGSVGSC